VDTLTGRFVPGGTVELCGWGGDAGTGRPLADLRIEIDGDTVGTVVRNLPRPDVVQVMKLPADATFGWCGQASLTGLASGPHALKVIGVSAAGDVVTCAEQELTVLPVSPNVAVGAAPDRPPVFVALRTVTRVILFLAALGLIGAPVALVTSRRSGLLGAPILGLALFGAGSEVGKVLKVSPFHVGLTLAMMSAVALGILWRSRAVRVRRVIPGGLLTLVPTVAFTVIGVIPMSVHGDGAVLGAIDDGTRECMVAESIRLYRWAVPPDVRGMFRMMPDQWELARNRWGGPFLLAGVAEAAGARAHEVHSAVILAAGSLVVLGVSWLATLVFPGTPRAWLLAGGLAATNGTILATLYGQHLGSLLLAALCIGFAACCLMLRGTRPIAALGGGVLLAGVATYYPEGFMVVGAVGALVLLTVPSLRRVRHVLGLLLVVALLAVAVNPVAMARSARQVVALVQAPVLVNREQRKVQGDTFYFPSLQVLTGLEPYRLDAPVYLRPPLRTTWNLVGLAVLLVLAVELRRVPRFRLRLLLFLLIPPGSALLANWVLGFPYGYAKILPIGAALVSVALVLPLEEALRASTSASTRKRRLRPRRASRLVIAAGAALVVLRFWPVAAVIEEEGRTIPAYDPAFAELAELSRTVGRRAVIRIDPQISLARRQWICYFLGENGFEVKPAAVNYPGADYYGLVDLRTTTRELAPSSFRGKSFALEYLGPGGGLR
jgi:hypothetical protein